MKAIVSLSPVNPADIILVKGDQVVEHNCAFNNELDAALNRLQQIHKENLTEIAVRGANAYIEKIIEELESFFNIPVSRV